MRSHQRTSYKSSYRLLNIKGEPKKALFFVVFNGSSSVLLTSANNSQTFEAGYYDAFTVSTDIESVGGTVTYSVHTHSTSCYPTASYIVGSITSWERTQNDYKVDAGATCSACGRQVSYTTIGGTDASRAEKAALTQANNSGHIQNGRCYYAGATACDKTVSYTTSSLSLGSNDVIVSATITY